MIDKPYKVYRIHPNGTEELLGKHKTEPNAVDLRKWYGLGVYIVDAVQGVYTSMKDRGISAQIFPKRIVIKEPVLGG